MFYQNTNDNKPGEDVTIVQANSSGLKDSHLGYSQVDACYLCLCEAPEVNIYTDCIALGGLLSKQLGVIMN